MNQTDFHKLISGQKPGYSVALVLFILRVAAIGYSIAIGLRNFLYTKGWLKTHRANAIVFSIGNITVGGTGKTPLVIWLCNLLRQKNIPCAILTRGYKTEKGIISDEPAIIAECCPQAKVIVNPDRVAGATEAVDVAWPSWPRFHLQITGRMPVPPKVLIMDDGFQHRRLDRDLDIVTIDATQPFGYDRLLPAGLLREPITALKRAHAAIITRCNQTTEAKLAELERKLQRLNPSMIIARSIHAPVCVKYAEPPVIPAKAGIQNNYDVDSCLRRNDTLETLKNKKIFAFCGIGNPDAFLDTIKSLGSELIGSKIYNDHHHYTENDIADIYEQAGRLKADLILTTQKDWTSAKYEIRNTKYEQFFAYLKIELKFTSGEDKLTALIKKALADKMPKK